MWKTLQGDFFVTEFRPFSVPDAGTEQMAAALEKYEHFGKSQFPTFGQYESWLGATLMIDGIEKQERIRAAWRRRHHRTSWHQGLLRRWDLALQHRLRNDLRTRSPKGLCVVYGSSIEGLRGNFNEAGVWYGYPWYGHGVVAAFSGTPGAVIQGVRPVFG